MLEFAPTTTIGMTYSDATLYCFFLEHHGHRDWRMPTEHDFVKHEHGYIAGWNTGKGSLMPHLILPVTPVRTI